MYNFYSTTINLPLIAVILSQEVIIWAIVLTATMIKNCGSLINALLGNTIRPCAVLMWKALLNLLVRLFRLVIRWLEFQLIPSLIWHLTSKDVDQITLVTSFYIAQMIVQATILILMRSRKADIWIWMAIHFNRYGSIHLPSYCFLIV